MIFTLLGRIPYGKRLPLTNAVADYENIKFSIPLEGNCNILQSNLVITPSSGAGRILYVPLSCTRDSTNICRATFIPSESHVRDQTYQIVLLIASKEANGGPVSSFKWEIGEFDFTNAHLANGKSTIGTDQREDVFEKIHLENRPPFAGEPDKPAKGAVLALIFCGIVLLPWVLLRSTWKELNTDHVMLTTLMNMTIAQKMFHAFLIAWVALAIADWRGLGTFTTLKIGSLLAIPTFAFGLKGLRQAISSSTPSSHSNQ